MPLAIRSVRSFSGSPTARDQFIHSCSTRRLTSGLSGVSICRRGPVPTDVVGQRQDNAACVAVVRDLIAGAVSQQPRTSGLLAALADRLSALAQCRRFSSFVTAASYRARISRSACRTSGDGV